MPPTKIAADQPVGLEGQRPERRERRAGQRGQAAQGRSMQPQARSS